MWRMKRAGSRAIRAPKTMRHGLKLMIGKLVRLRTWISRMVLSCLALVPLPQRYPDSAVYDFENGNLNEWNDVHGVVSTDTSRAYNGSYSLHGNESNLNFNHFMLGWTDVEFTIGRFELYYQETSSSQGHGYELVDSNNNQILGVGSGNPNTVATDGNGGAVAPGNMDYDVWVRVTVEVDYNNNEYWVEFHNTSDGTTVSTTQDLVNNVEATRFNYVNINGRSIGDRIGSTAAHIVWTDDILLEE